MAPHKSKTLCDGIELSESATKKLTNESLKWEDRKPIGIRFNPSDRALAGIVVDTFFQRPGNIVLSFFKFKNVYEHEPWNLSKFAHEFGEGKSYFFTSRKKKYGNGQNIERRAPGGFWRKTGSDSSIEITDSSIRKLSVTKTSLTFYKMEENSDKREKTGWLMKEYLLKMQNSKKPDDLEPLVLCVVYFHDNRKQEQYSESAPRIDDRSKQSSMPNTVVESYQVSDNFTALSSLYPPIPKQNSLDSYCLQNLLFADNDNPGSCHFPFSTSTHEIFGNSSINQLYPSSNPGMITLQQGYPIFLNSEQNMVMGSQGDTYRSSFPKPVSGTGFDLQMQYLLQSQYTLRNNLPNQPTYPLFSPVRNDSFGSFPEPHLDPWLQSGNEHESNQRQQSNSQISSDQIIQHQQPSDSAMTWNPNQQNPAEITPTNFSINQLYPSSNPGTITLQQGDPIFLNSEQNMVMGSQGATYWSSFPKPVSSTGFDLQIQDLLQSPCTLGNNLRNQQPYFMHDQPQADPCEDSNSIVCPPNNTIMNLTCPLLSPVPIGPFRSLPEPHLDPWLQSGNEHESNQQQQSNSQSSSDQIIQQQQPSDSAMTRNPNQQNPAEITPTNLQPFKHHLSNFDECGSMEIESLLLALEGNRDMNETEDYYAAWTG